MGCYFSNQLGNGILCDKNLKKNTKTSFVVFGCFVTDFNMASAKN
jgi:hypothetical protein